MGFFSAQKGFEFVKKWGPIGFLTHYSVSLTALAAIYYGVYANRNLFIPYLPEYVPKEGTDFVVAVAIHKLSLPIRVPLTMALIPIVHKSLKRVGVLGVFERMTSMLTGQAAASVVDEAAGGSSAKTGNAKKKE
ncbi:unnamed protein product [Amoebophrya sp. A25]|nr:unnamed protein product [Amoebophrya sp. A25]|eukprot:GSA25T00020380001.1